MLPLSEVTPALSKAFRYSIATDFRCSFVIVCLVSAMDGFLLGVVMSPAANRFAGESPRCFVYSAAARVGVACFTGSAVAPLPAGEERAGVGPMVAPPAQ